MSKQTLHTNMIGRRIRMLDEHLLMGRFRERGGETAEIVNVYLFADSSDVKYEALFDDGEIMCVVSPLFRVVSE